jgi:uncharacterized protein (DUF302 family)
MSGRLDDGKAQAAASARGELIVSGSARASHPELTNPGPGGLPVIPDGLTTIASRYGPRDTADRLVAAVTNRGMAVMARIDHAAAAASVGMELRPTEVLVFGNPRAGTPLMQKAQTIGIDLPLRALVWQDADGATWLGYNDPQWLVSRHLASPGDSRAVDGMTQALAAVAEEATGGPAS